MNILDIYRRARQHLPLTPKERAFLKFAQGLVVSAITSALFAAGQLILSKGAISWQDLWKVAAVAATVTVFNTLIKFFTARGEPELGDMAQKVEAGIVSKIQSA
ncbi:MAG TPA: hypothetical protein VH599_00125 [Ktedonobacterales bacterium]|jgi:hypothetical protein